MLNLIKKLLSVRQSVRDPVSYAVKIGVKIGGDCRLIDFKRGTFGSEPYLVTLGDKVTIASGVRFITHDGGVAIFREEFTGMDVVAPIRVGDNVFIGLNCIIMPGICIGNDCVIGAGSIVTKSIPSGSVAVGAPARVIKNIADYRASVLERAVDTKNLSKEDKRVMLEKHAKEYAYVE